MPEPPFDLASADRWFGIELNNHIMDALEAGRVTPETGQPFIHAAHASCHHWMQVGTVANHGRGEFAVASVYAAAGLGEAALRHARRCLELVEAHPGEMADWDLAFAYDALARAHASAGEVDAARRTREQAKAAGEAISDDEDRFYFRRWFEGGNWHGLPEDSLPRSSPPGGIELIEKEEIVSIQYTKSLPVVAEPDVLVCGTGLAGIGAAVGAARNGASVMAVDRMGFAGGFFTNIIGSAFDGFVYEGTGKPVVGGLVFEMLERMGVVEPGQAPHLSYNVNGDFSEVEKHPDRVIPRTDPELFKKAADEVLVESGVRLLFHTQVSDVIAKDGLVDSVVVSNKDGLVALRPRYVIDATGDADVAAWAGCPYEVAEPLQPMSLHFRIGFVELTFELRRKCAAVLEKARAEGRIGLYGGPWPATFSGRDIYFNVIRTPGNATNPQDWTNAEIQGRRDAWAMFELWKEALPEFKDAYFFTSGPTAGSRESRRIVGDYTLTGDDIRTAKRQDDAVVLGAWRIDRHPVDTAGYHDQPMVPPYDISYRTLLPQGVENLWVAGRCHSATSEALASSRVTANSMGMGQAAGTAAAMAGATGMDSRSVPMAELQDRLIAADVILDPESAML